MAAFVKGDVVVMLCYPCNLWLKVGVRRQESEVRR